MKALILILILLIPQVCYGKELTASWYSVSSLIQEGTRKFGEKPTMANGKEFKDEDMVCASWDYPLNTWLLVKNVKTGVSVIVKNSDRTARRFKGKRIDLSKKAFSLLANCKQGIVSVEVTELK
jgi:rare lipoprotein A